MLDRIEDELSDGLHVQLQHDLVLVVLNGLGCEVKMHCDLFGCLASCKETENFAMLRLSPPANIR